MNKTKIEWTDYSWNFVTGCDKVSAGCRECYAESYAKRFWGERKFTDVRIDESKLYLPMKWKTPRMIFVNSMSDLFHKKVSIEMLADAFDTMCMFPLVCRIKDCDHDDPSCFMRGCEENHIYQILTKRPQRMQKIITEDLWNYCGEHMRGDSALSLQDGVLPKNIWLGVSVEDQETADERIPLLLQTQAAVRWLSIEPMLEKIDLDPAQMFMDMVRGRETIDWIVIGCESGHNRRECKIEWVESIVEQCKRANVPVFVKQLQINGKVAKDISLFPSHLQIREYPKV